MTESNEPKRGLFSRLFSRRRPEGPAETGPAATRPAIGGDLDARAPQTRDWEVGDVIADLYDVVGVLGQGGMGRVYRVRHRQWAIDLAVKTPLPEALARAGGIEAFVHEAETWVRLGLHPHVAACHYVRTIDSVPRVFAEYVAGGTLSNWIAERRLYENVSGDRREALGRILEIAIQFAWGLHFAHEAGLVHQDVKPANVLMTREGVAKVTDFGLAMPQHAATGGMTRAYCSPEQAARGRLTRTSDVWSWAVSILEMFAGEVTWSSGIVAPDVLDELVRCPPDSAGIPPLPDGVARLLRRCVAKQPDERPQSLRDVAFELFAIANRELGQPPQQIVEPRTSERLADELNNRALSLLDLGRVADAERSWEAALAADPAHIPTLFNHQVVRWRNGRASDLDVVARLEALKRTRTDGLVESLLAAADLESGDLGRARTSIVAATTSGRDMTRMLLQVEEAAEQWRCAGLLLRDAHSAHVWLAANGGIVLTMAGAALDVRDASTGESLRSIKHGLDHIQYLEVSRLAALAATSGGTEIAIWDLETGRCRERVDIWGLLTAGAWGWQDTEMIPPAVLDQLKSRAKVRAFPLGGSALAGVAWNDSDPDDPSSATVFLRGEKGPFRTFEVNSWVTSPSVCPNGPLFLLAESESLTYGKLSNHRLRIRDAAGVVRVELRETFERISATAISDDGTLAVSGEVDGRLLVWNAETGELVRRLLGHAGEIESLHLAADGSRLLSRATNDTTRLWDLRSGQCIRTFAGEAFAIASGGNKLLVGLGPIEDARILFDVARLRMPRAELCFSQPTPLAKLSHAERQQQQILERGTAALERGDLAIARRALMQARTIAGRERVAAVLELQSKLLACATAAIPRALWCARELRAHEGKISALAFLDRDGSRAVSGGDDEKLVLFSTTGAEQRIVRANHVAGVEAFVNGITGLAASADARGFIASCNDGSFIFCDGTVDGDVRVTPTYLTGEAKSGFASDMIRIPLGRHLLEAFDGGRRALVARGLSAGTSLRNLGGPGSYAGDPNWDGLLDELRYVAPVPVIMALPELSVVEQLAAHAGPVLAGAVSADGTIATSAEGGEIFLRSASGAVLRLSTGSTDAALLAWNGTSLLAGTTGGDILRFEADGRSTRVAVIPELTAFAVAADGRTLVTGDAHGWIQVVDLGTGHRGVELAAHIGRVHRLAFSENRRFVLSAGNDRVVRLWEIEWDISVPLVGVATQDPLHDERAGDPDDRG